MQVKKARPRRVALKNSGTLDELRFSGEGLMPVVVQDWRDKCVLMVAYMNREALRRTLKTGLATYWSRSRKCFWVKGETSGHFQKVKKIYFDCDKDTLLLMIDQVGVACHTGKRSCFFTRMV